MSEPKEQLTRRTLSGLLWMAWGKGAYAVLQLVVLAVLARLLAPAEFGVVTAALVVIGFTNIFSQLGVGPAIVQRPTLEPRHIDTAFTTTVLFGLALGGLTWLGAPLAARFFRIDAVAPVLRVLALLFPLTGIGVVAESLVKRDLRFRWLAKLEVTTYAIGYGAVGIALGAAGWGVWALVCGEIARSALRSGVLLWDHPPRLRPTVNPGAFRELMYFGGGFTIARAANYLALQGDNLVVGRTLGPTALGLYGRAYSMMNAPAGIGAILDNVLFPAMAKVQHDPRRLARAYHRGVAMLGIVILPLSAILFVVSPEVVHVVLGPRWAGVVEPFRILALGMLFRTSYKMSDSLARSTGAVYRRAWRQIIYAGLVIGGAAVGQRWGIVGVATGVTFAVTANFLLMAQLSLSVVQTSWGALWRAHVPALALTAVATPVAWALAAALRAWHAPALGIAAAAGIAATLAMGMAAWRWPAVFLGPEASWALDTVRGYLPARWRRPAAPLSRVPDGAEGPA